ncbi:GGDEF domain-containing protein [Actinomycetota bacterium]|nr:GGDEF domain-containing protein [Actinomycetota bacterium]
MTADRPLEGVERQLSRSEELFRRTFDDAPIGMAIVSLDGRFEQVNRALTTSLGMPAAALLGTTFQQITHPDDLDADLDFVARLVAGEIPSYQMEKRYVTGEGEIVRARLTVSMVRDELGRPMHFVSQIENIEQMRRTEDLLRHRALHDPLTGLANRSLLLERLGAALAHPTGSLVAVAFTDVDHFKRVNDSLGHDAGDLLLRVVADRMRSAARSGDTVARIGGDEFVVLLEPVDTAEQAGELLTAIIAAVELPLRIGGHDLVPRISAGLTVNDGSAKAERVLRDADTALSVAKDSGRRRWEIYQDTYRDEALRRISIEGELRTAIGAGDFVLHYQPIVDLHTRAVVAYEALIRWDHHEQGLRLPGEFIEISEDSDLIIELGGWVLSEAVGFLARHPELPGRVYINVSPRQIGRRTAATGTAGLADQVAAELLAAGVPPHRLGIEITESGVLEANEHALEDLHGLAALGVHLVLDDFGTGYSALSSVLSAPVGGLKLDRSFTQRLGDEGPCDRISVAIAALVDSLDASGVVEGVETEDHRRLALAHGWHLGQGWLFGYPEPESSMPWLARGA